jgi:hypothetical protein
MTEAADSSETLVPIYQINGTTSQKTIIFIVTAMRISNLTWCMYCLHETYILAVIFLQLMEFKLYSSFHVDFKFPGREVNKKRQEKESWTDILPYRAFYFPEAMQNIIKETGIFTIKIKIKGSSCHALSCSFTGLHNYAGSMAKGTKILKILCCSLKKQKFVLSLSL